MSGTPAAHLRLRPRDGAPRCPLCLSGVGREEAAPCEVRGATPHAACVRELGSCPRPRPRR
ncbi:MAG: hypothetical protein R3F62_25640 [Planctomycetota bacterium]